MIQFLDGRILPTKNVNRLMGCQDLLEEVPGRSRREKENPGDLRSFVKGVTGRSSSKSYNIKDEISSK